MATGKSSFGKNIIITHHQLKDLLVSCQELPQRLEPSSRKAGSK
jgi:hypothetical protein